MENPTAPLPAASPAADSKLHFLDYWRIVRIRKTVIFAVFLLVVITTTIVTYWLPQYYSSTVRISVDKDTTDIPGLFDFRQAPTQFDPYFINSEFEKIQSKRVLYQVVTNLDLNKKWGVKYNSGVPLSTPESYMIMKRRVDVRQSRNTSLIEIRVLDESRDEAADIANDIARVYKETRLKMREDASQGGIDKLTEKYNEQEGFVTKLANKVATMRETNHINDAVIDSGQVTLLDTETVRRLLQELVSASATYTQMKNLCDDLSKMPGDKLRQALPTAYPDTALAELLSRYTQTEVELAALQKDLGDKHPSTVRDQEILTKVNKQINDKIEGIMTGLRVRVEALKSEVDDRTKALEAAKNEDYKNGKLAGDYILAKKDLDSQRRILDTLRLRIVQETVDSKLPKTTIVEVYDKAEPGLRPVRPNIPLNIALGVVVGLIVGIGLAFFIEYLDTSVKTIDDVERSLQAPVLGVIPQNVGYLIDEGADSPHAEAYRVLRTNLLFSRKDGKLNTVTIVSGGAGEGKSTTVFNLATVFAQNGQRVLVVDSDLRRPSLHKFLKVSNSLGLTNYLLKQKELEEVVQTTQLPTLDFLPSGKLPSSSMGILNSVRMKEFINEVKRRYDMVFFDSPPIMGVSDASILASEVDMTLLVVQYRKYPQIMTVRAKQMVEKVGGHLMGVVLNNINISQDSYYYYYSGYYYDYYYSKKDDDAGGKEGKEKKSDGQSAKVEIKQKY